MRHFPPLLVGLLALLWTTVCPAQARQPSVVPGVVVLKLAAGSQLAADWFAEGRRGPIGALVPVLGEHTTRGYISDATLQAVQKRLAAQHRKSGIGNTLSHLCIVNYSLPLEPGDVVRALAALPGVLYAEPMPQRSIGFVPNDPRVQEQYHLAKLRVFEAWDLLPANATAVTVAIVDTGVDYLHEDLAANIFINTGEDVNDNGIVDPGDFNGRDDDNNGFVDDLRGWDFTGQFGDEGDNDPRPGNAHGTHVAGLVGAVIDNAVGVAGMAPNVRLLPVKIGIDDPNSTSVANGYEGIVYAAAMGADVINCSWGGATNSSAEGEIVESALALGSLVVAAAGNESREVAFYPAAYPNVLSVGSVNESDMRSGFSNYHATVDVAAPGSSVLSTYPRPINYAYESGTSMASPVVAGLAALVRMKYPSFTALQIGEQIKATTDNIDDILDPFLLGKFGTGRVNAYRALQEDNAKSALIIDYTLHDDNDDLIFEPGEQVRLTARVLNVLAPIRNARLTASTESSYNIVFSTDTAPIGDMTTYEQRSTEGTPIVFTIPQDIPLNYMLELDLFIREESGVIGRTTLRMTLNPTYRTFRRNNITVTFNSTGNIGFNDYPDNEQGEGFRYRNSSNLLYEGALMIATGPGNISNVARGSTASATQDRAFVSTKFIDIKSTGSLAGVEGVTEFRDQGNPDEVGVRVRQTVLQSDSTGMENAVFVIYEITNTSGRDFTTLYTGLYFDWDIGISGANDIASFYAPDNIGYVYNARNTELPFVGMQLHTEHELNYFAMDNDGSTPTNPGVYNGYTRAEKWQTMSSGIGRTTSNITDVSTVISAGPIALASGRTETVAFSLFAGTTFEELREHGDQARAVAADRGIGNRRLVDYTTASELVSVFPNPVAEDDLTVAFTLSARQPVTLQMFDVLGRLVFSATDLEAFKVGYNTWTVPVDTVASLATGTYLVQLVTADAVMALPVRVIH